MNFPELYCYINKLKIKQIGLEKSENDFIRNMNMNYDGTIQKYYDKLKHSREDDCNDLRKDVQDNLLSLKHIKTAIVEKNLENIDLEKLKNGMMSYEHCTTFIKQRITAELENLANEELSLSIETTNIEMKLTDYNKQDHEYNKISKYSTKCTSNQYMQEDVKEFVTFLNETGGHNGGWNHEDHLLFLKIFNKIKNKMKLVQSLHTLFPDMSKEILLNHIDWYKEYLQLKKKQKAAIEKWRENKTKKEKDSEETKHDSEDTKKPKTKENPEKDLACTREKVEKWKTEKQQKIEQDLEIEIEKLNKTRETEKQKQVKQQETKTEVRKWKNAKEAKQRAEFLAKEIISLREKERRMLLTNKLIREYQNQDNVYISKRLNKLKINVNVPKGSKNKESPRKCKNGSRNPDRIFKATRQWIARTSHEQIEENMFNKHLPLRKIPKLAVPVWRQSVPQN